MPISFRLRTWPLLATLLLATLGIALGQWQTRRALEKQMQAEQQLQRMQLPPVPLNQSAAGVQAHRRLSVRGHFLSQWPVYLDNRPLHGQAGFYVLMPFQVEGDARHLLVARGWQARDAQERSRLPVLYTPPEVLELQCVVRDRFEQLLQLGQAAPLKPGAIVQNLEPAQLAQQSGLPFYPFVCEQTSVVSDRLLRDWPRPAVGADKHRAYAFQWYALACMAVIFFVLTGFRNGKNR